MDNSLVHFSQHGPLVDLDLSRMGKPTEEIREKPLALNTARLKEYRHVTRGAILNILETGHVTMEFLKRHGEVERVAELFMVSADGQEIYVEQWKADSVAMTDHQCQHYNQTFKTFSYDELPEKYWKKYAHACKFVDLVKSKTAKVTIYSDKAKGVLMENHPPNFEATFLQGPKIVMSGRQVYIKEDSGAGLTLDSDCATTAVNAYTRNLLLHASQLREQCLRLEASVRTVQATATACEDRLFPVTVGRRPSTSFCSSSSSSNSDITDLWLSPRFGQQHPSPSHLSDESFMSLPPSPVALLDLRWKDTPQTVAQANDPSFAAMDNTSCGTPSSPVRHLSTLAGRRQRSQMIASPASSAQYDSYSSTNSLTSHPSHNFQHHFRDSIPEENVSYALGAKIRPWETFGGTEFQRTFHPHNCSVATSPVIPSPASFAAMSNETFANDTYCPASSRTDVTSQNTHDLQSAGNNAFTNSGQIISDPSFSKTRLPHPQTMTVPAATRFQDDELDVHTSTVIHKSFVPYTGWVLLLENGTIWVCYNEGTQLGMKYDQPTEVVYVDQGGVKHRYIQSDTVPEVVKQKMERLPMIIEETRKIVARLNP